MDVFSAYSSTTDVGNVLGNATTTSTSGSNIAALVQAQAQARLKTQQQETVTSFQGRLTSLSDQLAQLTGVSRQVGDAITKLQGASGALGGVSTSLDNLTQTLTNAENSSSITSAWATAYQGQLAGLNSMVDGTMLAGQGPAVMYPTTANGSGMQSFVGDDMGSGYYIVGSDGHVWASNPSGTALIAYSSYPDTPANESSSIQGGGTKLVSISGNSVTFTVNANSSLPQTLSGTLVRQGLGLLDPWMYDNFTTASGLARAKADLADAKTAVQAEQNHYGAAIAVAQYFSNKLGLVMDGVKSQQTATATDEQTQLNDLQKKSQDAQASLGLALQGQGVAGDQLVSQLTTTGGAADILTASSTPDYPVFDIFA